MSEDAGQAAFDPKAFVKTLTHRPGVYRMLGPDGEVVYVGKAKNLQKRVASYFSGRPANTRIQSMLAQLSAIEVTVTGSEAEALLLENNLIKQHRPRYNVLLRDDKSYPYIYVSTEDPFPRLAFHRGSRARPGRFFGPYPSAGAVRQTLALLQKLFRVRQCEDSFFANRSRPCLQYQIKRCTAPCVGLIDAAQYALDVEHAIKFLEGDTDAVIEALVARMEQASQALAFEEAAHYRDQIERLRKVATEQFVSGATGDLDILACGIRGGIACVQVFFIRGGHNLGNKSFFPSLPHEMDEAAVLTAFIGQYYLSREIPAELMLSHAPEDHAVLEEMLSLRRGRKTSLSVNVRGDRARWLELARQNVEHALAARLATRSSLRQRYEALQEALDLEAIPERMECFDISHTGGELAVASCVVFDTEGPVKSDYRRFNIEDIEPGDDYAAMRQALLRRYRRLREGEGRLPDLLLIDGGKGQVRQAREVLEELQVEGVLVMGIAKGEGRRPGLETLVLSDRDAPSILPASAAALHLLQQIRDEAHRFAITGHRQRRAKARSSSPLEQIAGLGPKRRQGLLKRFGGIRGVSAAGVQDLAKTPGISKQLAQRIYDHLHSNET
jgi:excinuclease ABC subunit C